MIDNFHTQIIGNGPAAFGLPLKTIAEGEDVFESYSSGGVAIIGPQKNLGSGNLNYNLLSNSSADDFLQTIPPQILAKLSGSKILSQISQFASHLLPIKIVAQFERAVAEQVLSTLNASQNQKPFFDAFVAKIKQNKNGELVSFDQNQNPIAVSKNVIISAGAQQIPLHLEPINQEKLIFSDQFLKLSNDEIRNLVSGKKVAIIGGSHSALSCLDNIRSATLHVPISLFHRSDFKIYFKSELEAQNAKYPYLPSDLDSGQIHRFRGLRGGAKLRLQISPQDLNLKFIKFAELSEISPALDEVDLIIQATGYRPKIIPVVDKNGLELHQIPLFDQIGLPLNQSTIDQKEIFGPVWLEGAKIFYNGIGISPREGVNLFQGEFAHKILFQLNQ